MSLFSKPPTPLPVVIPKSKTINLGGGAVLGQERLGIEIDIQSRSDLRGFMWLLMATDTQQQIDQGNDPQLLTVDGKTNKPLEEINRNASIIFGTALAQEAMDMIERELQRNIAADLLIDTGALINMSNWHWLFVQKGKGATIVGDPSQLPSFSRGDTLVFYPFNIPYASWANMQAKALDGRKGFMARATAAVRKLPVFKQFAVYAMFTSAHSVPGDTYPHGTPIIVVRPRIRRTR